MSNQSDKSDPELMLVIRDAFLRGRDLEAIEMLALLHRSSEPTYYNRMLSVRASDLLNSGEIRMVTARPQQPFRGLRFALPASIAPFFTIHDIRVGVNTMLLEASDLDGEFFAARTDLFDNEDIIRYEMEVSEDLTSLARIRVDRVVPSRLGVAIDMPWCNVGQLIVVSASHHYGHPLRFRGAFFGYTRDDNNP